MLIDVKLFRRHGVECVKNRPGLREDNIEAKGCRCNLGFKGWDPAEKKFRRLMFIPAITETHEAWRKLVESEQGIVPVLPTPIVVPTRITVRDAFEEYLGVVRSQRLVAESSIYAMFRPVGNMIQREADKLRLKYMDELTTDFATTMIETFSVSRREERMTPEEKAVKKPKPISVNVQGQYRMYFEDFCRVARKQKWTSVDICEKLEPPKRGHAHTKPLHPTMPFDLVSEFPKIVGAIRHFGLPKSGTKRSLWRDNPQTTIAFFLTLRHSGLRLGDSLMFDPRRLEPTTINGQALYTAVVSQEKTGERGMTPTVKIYIPKQDGDLIINARRFSERYAFVPVGIEPVGSKLDKEKFILWRNWKNSTYTTLFRHLEHQSGVSHVHAHRFRDTFAREIWMTLKSGGGMAALAYLSKRLGHSSVKVTMEHYMQWLEEDQSEADFKFFGKGN